MTENPLYDLLKIGLTEGEAKVYIAMIELGSSTVGPIVKKSGVAYSNVYDILNRLMDKGVATYILKSKTKYFQAVSPSNLLVYLEKKEAELNQQKKALKKALPQLESLQEFKAKQEAEIFVGKKGLRAAYEKLFTTVNKDEEDLFFYIYHPEYGKEADLFYLSIQEIIKKLPIRGISNTEGRESLFAQSVDFIRYRFVDFPIPGNLEVCGDKTLFVSWEKPTIGVLITSKSIADNLRNYFDTVWVIAKE